MQLFVGIFLLVVAKTNSFVNPTLSIECPGNDVSAIRQQVSQFELTLILYYVSWCRESRAAKKVYDEIASHYHEEIQFAAVDCWHLECNCSRTIPSSLGSKKGYPHSWPTLLVHYGSQVTIQYHDEWRPIAMSRFVNNLFRPVLRINSKEELKILNMRSNAVLLGLFENASSIEYHRFTISAVRWLENDPEKLVAFAVCLGTAANEIMRGLSATTPLIVLLSDKQIEVFNLTRKWTSIQLNSWLQGEVKRLSKHFVGFSTPSLLMDHVRKGAVLAIFANDMEKSNKNFYIHMSSFVQSLGIDSSVDSSTKVCGKEYATELDCDILLPDETKIQELQMYYENPEKFCRKAPFSLSSKYAPFSKLYQHYSDLYMMKFQPTVQFYAKDRWSGSNLLKYYRYNECFKGHHRRNIPELQIVFAKLLTKFIERVSQNSTTRHNRTMSVQIMNNSKYKDILRTLGAENLESTDTLKITTVLIIEPNQEGVYALQKPFNYETLLGFIKDYYHDNLSISRKSGISVNAAFSSCPSSAYCLHEMSRKTFLNSIQHHWHNTTTILLLYTPRCAFSSMMSHVLIQISALLQNAQQFHYINMVRLNTQKNDMPWEFVTHSTPSLIVFPRGYPSESRIFPSNLKIDVRNVFAFILAQLDPVEQVRVALSSCSPPHYQLMKCLQFTKTLAMQHIGEHLKLWQIFEDQRQVILTRLKQFKDITLDIQERFLL